MKTLLILLLVAVLLIGAWVRLAPTDPAKWHRRLDFDADRDLEGGARRVLPGQGGRLADLDAIARATPRTEVLAGSLQEGRITYVTRSALWRFPDYTTVERDGGDLKLFARLRFGRGDMGVNRARLEEWIRRLEAR